MHTNWTIEILVLAFKVLAQQNVDVGFHLLIRNEYCYKIQNLIIWGCCNLLYYYIYTNNVKMAIVDVAIYLANWPDVRISAWETLLKARAIENLAFSIGVNIVGSDPNQNKYIGHSYAFDPYGKKISKDLKEKKGVLYVGLERKKLTEARDDLKFLEDRDEFVLKL